MIEKLMPELAIIRELVMEQAGPRFGDGREEALDVPRLVREAHGWLARANQQPLIEMPNLREIAAELRIVASRVEFDPDEQQRNVATALRTIAAAFEYLHDQLREKGGQAE